MKNKKTGIIIACLIIVSAVIASIVFVPIITDSISVRNYMAQDIKNVDNVVLVAECPEVDGQAQSIAGVKEAVRLGADAVKVDLCFRADNTPVITDNYENNNDADTVEKLFSELNDEKYKSVKLYLNIVQLSSLTELNRLTVEYNMVGRVYIIGIDKSHYGLVTSDSTIVPFLLKYDFTKEDIRSIEEGKFQAPGCINEYGAAGLEIDAKYSTPEIVSTLDDFGIPFIVSGIGSSAEFCEMLLNGATTVIVDNIKPIKDLLDGWTDAMRDRHSSILEQSIKDLDNK